MFEPETDSDDKEETVIQGRLQFDVSEWQCSLCIALYNIGHVTVISLAFRLTMLSNSQYCVTHIMQTMFPFTEIM